MRAGSRAWRAVLLALLVALASAVLLTAAALSFAFARVSVKDLPYWSLTTSSQYRPSRSFIPHCLKFFAYPGRPSVACPNHGTLHPATTYRCTGPGAPGICPYDNKVFSYGDGVTVLLQVATPPGRPMSQPLGHIFVVKLLKGGYMVTPIPGPTWTPLDHTWGKVSSSNPTGGFARWVKGAIGFGRVTKGTVYRRVQ